MAEADDNFRQRIFDAMSAKIEPIAGLQTVEIGYPRGKERDRPGVWIIPIDDQKENASKLHSSRKINFRLRVLVEEGADSAARELNRLLLAVSDAVNSDKRLGGLLADDLREGATIWLFLDPQWPQAGADIEIECKYPVS